MTQIPSPPGLPLLGNLRDIDPVNSMLSFSHMADQYGPIYRLNLMGRMRLIVTSYELLNEMCDEKRFRKVPNAGLMQLRNGAGDGLFTAFEEEENWGMAHRLLMPQFGPLSITKMYDEMYEIACQMVTKWARLGPDHRIDPPEQFTRLTLDSIALCSMDTRFNSFDRADMHPFVDAMVFFLRESGMRSLRPQVVSDYVYRQSTREYFESIETMRATALHVINERKAHPSGKKDLVDAMINGKDPKTGKSLPTDNIINNQITFMIAGHETTSGMLSFLFVELVQNPRAMAKLQKEVDTVVGTGPVLVEHMSKLPYLTACLRETLRLHATAPAFEVRPRSTEDADFPMYMGKERYIVNKDDNLNVILPRAQIDPAVWGEDAKEFKPERMLDENFNKLPPNCWKPFGNGMRACIGRAFAWQEAHIITALLTQNFTFRAEDPSYKLEIMQTLTIKPKGFYMYAKLRDNLDPIALERRLWDGKSFHTRDAKDKKVEEAANAATKKSPLDIFYGSNTGTSEALAQSLANTAAMRGYDPNVQPLDAAADSLATDRPVLIISASYEGEPPDNAGRFVEWLRTTQGNSLEGVKYAVFGCGHSDWAATYQKIPTMCDDIIEKRGGKRVCTRGFANAADNDIFNDFDAWQVVSCDKTFWPGIAKEYGTKEAAGGPTSHGLDVEIETGTRSTDLRQDVREGVVQAARTLTAPGEPEKRHIEILLPSGMSYTAGDYLAVLPMNHDPLVKSVMARFSLPWDAKIRIPEGQHTSLPTGRDMTVYELLAAYVELNQPATQKNIAALAGYDSDETSRKALLALTASEVAEKRISVLDLLHLHPTCALPFGDFLSMLPPLRVRQYSISSSPLSSPTVCSLTYGVLDQESKSGAHGKRFKGIASTYLSELSSGDKIRVAVRPSHVAFHLPLDVANVPVIMVCAGSGIAPFRGFIQERATQLAAGRKLAPALLFVGCRAPARDVLYADELSRWQDLGAVNVRYAFSRAKELSQGCGYVQERLWRDIAEAVKLWEDGAKIFVCGNAAVGEAVRDVVCRAYLEGKGSGKTEDEARAWFETVKEERYASDVFA